ncbi:MAG: cation transporter [Clostridiales bacterium]|nr:cation transporter [Clostridiales bacterium]
MKTEKKIYGAFILNLFFAIFEFIGGVFTGSIAIISDAIHDLGDATSIGVSFFLEKKSKQKPNEKYTYGYARFSVLGGLITTLILIVGSLFVIYNAVNRFLHPVLIHYNGMLFIAAVGFIVNLVAALITHGGNSLNQKAVNLHMLEDVLGWIFVFIGAIIMRFTDFSVIDPILSICVALFVLFHACKNLKEVLNLFLLRTPKELNLAELKNHLLEINGVLDVHHIHLSSLDGENMLASLHIVTKEYLPEVKFKVKEELREHGICHATVEMETTNENCIEKECAVCEMIKNASHCHHHH